MSREWVVYMKQQDDYFLMCMVSFGKLHPHESPADTSSWETKDGESTSSGTSGSVGGDLLRNDNSSYLPTGPTCFTRKQGHNVRVSSLANEK